MKSIENDDGAVAFVIEISGVLMAERQAPGAESEYRIDNVLTNNKLDVMFGSDLNDLMYVSGDQFQLYFNWESQMKTIEGVTCQRFGTSPQR